MYIPNINAKLSGIALKINSKKDKCNNFMSSPSQLVMNTYNLWIIIYTLNRTIYNYKNIKGVQIVPVKDKFNIIVFTNKATLTFKVSKNNKFLVEENFKKYRIKITRL